MEAFDFRRVEPSAVRVAKGATRNMYSLAPRIPVQFPRVAVTVSLGNFGYNALLKFDPNVASHAKFATWLEAVEAETCAQMTSNGVGPREELGERWNSTLKGFGDSKNMYATIGTDAIVFDENDEILEASPTRIKFADFLMELQGVWTSSDQMGLRWRVVQVREASAPPRAPPPKPAFADDEDDEAYAALLKPELDEENVFKKRRLEIATSPPALLFVEDF
jgi:hypothetical protein